METPTKGVNISSLNDLMKTVKENYKDGEVAIVTGVTGKVLAPSRHIPYHRIEFLIPGRLLSDKDSIPKGTVFAVLMVPRENLAEPFRNYAVDGVDV